MVKMSGGKALAQSLVRGRVEVVFGIPGIHVYGILAAIRDEPSIRMVTTRHEQGAAHMADGYARASGKPGVVLVVPGAGVYNAASGLATAYAAPRQCSSLPARYPAPRSARTLGPVTKSWTSPTCCAR